MSDQRRIRLVAADLTACARRTTTESAHFGTVVSGTVHSGIVRSGIFHSGGLS